MNTTYVSPRSSAIEPEPPNSNLKSDLLRFHSRWWSVIIWMILGSSALAAPGASLEWDANTEPDIAGYKLHYGTSSGTYTKTVDTGNATTVNVPELISGFTYYFAVTAYNDAGLESPPSNEVTFTVPRPAGLQITYLPRPAVPIAPGTPLEYSPLKGPGDGGFAFTVTAAERTAVIVYASTDLQTWEVQGGVTNPTGRLVIKDLTSPAYRRKYYRVEQAEIDPVVD